MTQIAANARQSLGQTPPIWRPSAMQANATAQALSEFSALRGPHGITRLAAPFGADDMSEAVSLSDYIARCTLYLNLPEVQEALTRGLCIFEINGVPKYLSSSADETVLGGSGWKAFRAAKPSDLSATGSWYTAMNALVNLAMGTLGIPAPRNPDTGLVDLSRRGMAFQFFNEPNNEVFWGYNGSATIGDYLLAYRRFCEGARAANPDFVVCGPVSAGALSTRTDKLYATHSADFFSFTGTAFIGGTEATGRRDDNPTRSYWKFGSAPTLAPSAIGSVTLALSQSTPTGDVSAESWSIRGYATNGQTDPETQNGSTRFNNCSSGNLYVSGDTALRTSGEKTITLGGAIATDLAAAAAAGTAFTLGMHSALESTAGAAQRYAVPRGYDAADINQRPRLDVQYSRTLVELFIDYVAANSLELDMVDVHNFQDDPEEFVESGMTSIRAALALNNLDVDLPVIVTEFQNDSATSGVRDDYRSAAYFLGSVHAHWQAGYSAMCMATLLKLGSAPTVDNLFTDQWGMILNGTVSGYYVACPNFMLMRLLEYVSQGEMIECTPLVDASIGLRSVAFREGNSAFIFAARWDEGGGSEVVDFSCDSDMGLFAGVRVWRFNSTTNDPKSVYNATSGSSAPKAAAALAAGDRAQYSASRASVQRLTLGEVEAVVLQFLYEGGQ